MEMDKEILSIIAIILALVGYLPYIKDTVSGKTRPHIYSWLVAAILNIVIFGVQFNEHVGLSAFVILLVALVCTTIMILGLKNGTKDITKKDGIFLGLALGLLFFWIFVKDNLVSSILVVLISNIGFIPTIRKTFVHPFSETFSTYFLSTIRNFLVLFSFEVYSIPALLPPFVSTIVVGLFCIMMLIRRSQVRS